MSRRVLVLALALSTLSAHAASAAEGLSDRAFLEAARCRALTAASGGDTVQIDALLKKEQGGREPAVLSSARNMLAKPVKGEAADLAMQRDKVCKPFATAG